MTERVLTFAIDMVVFERVQDAVQRPGEAKEDEAACTRRKRTQKRVRHALALLVAKFRIDIPFAEKHEHPDPAREF